MKKRIISLLIVAALLCVTAVGAMAESKAEIARRYCGIWTAKGVVVKIWTESGEIHCKAAFRGKDKQIALWDYGTCWYDKKAENVSTGSVTKTLYKYDSAKKSMVEKDWSMSDMYFSTFAYSASDGKLIWTDDAFKKPVKLTRYAGKAASK